MGTDLKTSRQEGPAVAGAAPAADHLADPLQGAALDAGPDVAEGGPGGPNQGEIAIYLIEQLQQGSPDPLAGLGAEARAPGQKVMAILDKNRQLVQRCVKDGLERRAGGATERVKPAPPHAIAGLLGLAPRDPTWLPPA